MISLPIVSAKTILEGRVSSNVERAIRRLESGTAAHQGALRAGAALCDRGLKGGLPPSVAAAPRRAIELARSVAAHTGTGGPSLGALERELLGSYEAVEQSAVRAFLPTLPQPPGECPIFGQEASWAQLARASDRAFQRSVSLSAHLTLDAHVELLRSIGSPSALIDVIIGLAGAHAYLTCAAGSLRHVAFRTQAFVQAHWDSERPTSRRLGQSLAELAEQTLHEFLGAKFASHVVREQAALEEFFLWAMSGE